KRRPGRDPRDRSWAGCRRGDAVVASALRQLDRLHLGQARGGRGVMARGQVAAPGPKLTRQLIVVIGCFLLGVAIAALISSGATRSAASPGLLGLIGLIVASVVLAAGAAWIWKQLETRGVGVPKISADGSATTKLRESPVWRLGQRRLAAAFSQVGPRRGGTA